MKTVLFTLAGGVITFLIIQLLKKDVPESNTAKNLIDIARTDEAKILFKSEPFRNLIHTNEFKKFATDFGTEQLLNILTI